jgi:hypothetical protein
MGRREKHRRAEQLKRGGPVIIDELAGRPKAPPAARTVATQEPGTLAFMVLEGMQGKPHVYQGTADPVVVQARRARNKAARATRRRQQRRARR